MYAGVHHRGGVLTNSTPSTRDLWLDFKGSRMRTPPSWRPGSHSPAAQGPVELNASPVLSVILCSTDYRALCCLCCAVWSKDTPAAAAQDDEARFAKATSRKLAGLPALKAAGEVELTLLCVLCQAGCMPTAPVL